MEMVVGYKIKYREDYWWKKMLYKIGAEECIIDCLELQRGQEILQKNGKKYVNREIRNVGCKKTSQHY